MAKQARAEATRQKILDASVELFSDLGYGETGLADVLSRAGVSKGAFYYHFDSKEALATAIIDDFDRKAAIVVDGHFDMDSPKLAGLIEMTFGVQALMHRDPVTRVGQMLSQALGQVSDAGSKLYSGWTQRFVEMVERLVEAGEIRKDVVVVDVAETIWSGVLGAHLLSAAIGDDPYTRLARTWRVMLRAVVDGGALPGFEALLAETARHHRAVAG